MIGKWKAVTRAPDASEKISSNVLAISLFYDCQTCRNSHFSGIFPVKLMILLGILYIDKHPHCLLHTRHARGKYFAEEYIVKFKFWEETSW